MVKHANDCATYRLGGTGHTWNTSATTPRGAKTGGPERELKDAYDPAAEEYTATLPRHTPCGLRFR
jgi:hypothetical protein